MQKGDFINATFDGNEAGLTLNRYGASISTKNKNHHVVVNQIFHLLDQEGNLLLEGSIENDQNGKHAYNFVVYIRQFVNSISANKKKSTHIGDLS